MIAPRVGGSTAGNPVSQQLLMKQFERDPRLLGL